MAKRSRRKKSRRSWRLPPLGETWSRLGGGRWLNAAAWVAGMAALVAGAISGLPRLEAAVGAQAAPARMSVHFVEAPAWVEGDLRAMLEATVLRHLGGDPFAQHELAAARQALLDTAWFESVEQVRRVRADRVEVRASFAQPFAVVRDAIGDHLIDRSGRLLPLSYPPPAAETSPARARVRRFVITGAHFDRPPYAGQTWPGADITAALRLLRIVAQRPWFEQVESIDAGRFLQDGTLVLVTDIGARIIWGSAPGDEPPGEVPAEGKLAYLDTAHEQFERIDRGHDGELYFLHEGYIAR